MSYKHLLPTDIGYAVLATPKGAYSDEETEEIKTKTAAALSLPISRIITSYEDFQTYTDGSLNRNAMWAEWGRTLATRQDPMRGGNLYTLIVLSLPPGVGVAQGNARMLIPWRERSNEEGRPLIWSLEESGKLVPVDHNATPFEGVRHPHTAQLVLLTQE